MFDAELLRKICKELLAEKDSERLQELLSLLCALVEDDREEVRLKLRQLSGRYPSLREKSTQKVPKRTGIRNKKGKGSRGPELIS
jgi:hypothetical protein